MIGTIANVCGILAGGIAGLLRCKPLSPARESFFKVAIGAFTVYYGLRLTWLSVNGSFLQILKQLLVAIVALMLGKLMGRLLHLQKFSNRLGHAARERIVAASNHKTSPGDGFKACAVLFCAAPLGILGAAQDGLTSPGYFYPLIVKGVMDGLATFGFVGIFGWGVILAALPVLAFQGSITLVCQHVIEPFLRARDLVDPVNAAGGLLVFSVALVILELKRIELADYLPALAFAPLLAWVSR
jgi:uncharacterized membrane protein YqgA involved in biofilm formation